MGDETVNGANTGVFGRFMACGWGCVGYDKGRGKEWGLNGVGKAWKRRWKMTEMEALAEADASFFVVCRMGKKKAVFVVILELGLQLGLQKGVTLDGERGYKKWK